jgi:hypothetical protein
VSADRRDPFAFQNADPERALPRPIEEAVEQEERTEAALDRAAGVEPEPPPVAADGPEMVIIPRRGTPSRGRRCRHRGPLEVHRRASKGRSSGG